ncbi:MAG: hypothetical protein HOQ13_12320 [Dermatophilaceae bacterium]|nr:hypothetical protein [Dermatophilaceae bacterium]
MTTILLGPQRFTTTVGTMVRSLDVEGPIAMVNSGWEERESDDAELADHLDGRGVNLRLYRRAFELLRAEPQLRAVVLDHRSRHDELRAFYGIRLQSAWDTVFAVRHRTSRHGIGEGAERSALQALRDVDDWYAWEVARLVEQTAVSDVVRGSAALAAHRAEVAELLASSAAVVVAGGHIGLLMETLRLFAVSIPATTPVVAWSAGAMAVCDPVVLFHDFAPHGVTAPEVHDRGLGRVRGVVPLPHARRRLDLDDRDRMAVFAARFPAHRLVPLDAGTVIRLGAGSADAEGRALLPEGTRVLTTAGTLVTEGAA